MKKYIKLIVILVIIMSFYSVGVVIVAKRNGKVEKLPLNDDTQNNEDDDKQQEIVSQGDYVFVLDSKLYLNYKDGSWYEYEDFDYSEKKFDVYINNIKFGNYSLNYGGKWYIIDDDRNYIDYDGSFMAVYSNMNYSINPVVSNQFDIVDQSNVNSFLSDLNITFSYNDISKSKILYDINKDGMKDIVYFVSNAFSDDDGSSNNAFAYVFVKDAAGKETVIYSYKDSTDNLLSMSNPSFGNIVEIDGKEYLFVLNEKNSGVVNYYVYNMSDSYKLVYKSNIE